MGGKPPSGRFIHMLSKPSAAHASTISFSMFPHLFCKMFIFYKRQRDDKVQERPPHACIITIMNGGQKQGNAFGLHPSLNTCQTLKKATDRLYLHLTESSVGGHMQPQFFSLVLEKLQNPFHPKSKMSNFQSTGFICEAIPL